MFHQIIKSKGNLFPNIREERERMSLSKHLPSEGTEIFLVILKIILQFTGQVRRHLSASNRISANDQPAAALSGLYFWIIFS